jgi:transposase
MSLYAGIDLHGDNGYYAIVDEENKRLYGKKLPNDLKVVLKELKPFGKIEAIAVESTYNWYWLVDGLMDNNYNVKLANPAAMEQYNGLKNVDDQTDAFFIANQLRLGLLKYGYIYPREGRALRDVLRRRMFFVQQRTAQILSFQSLYSRQTGEGISGGMVYKLTDEEIRKLFKDENVWLMADAGIKTIRYFTKQINEFEKTGLSQCKIQDEFKHLYSVPGIGDILTLTIMLETGNISRFENVGNYTSYCRGVSADKYSNEKKKGKNNRKNGNKYLAWAYVEAANYMIRHCPEAQVWYQRKLAKCKKVVAIKALSAKIAKACYFIMRDQVDFDVKKIFA